MTPENFLALLTGLDRAADFVEAIDNGELQKQRGWDLSDWQYHLVPWGCVSPTAPPAPGL